MKNRVNSKYGQSGLVLVVCLIMLLLLTLIGVSGSQVTNLEEKMAGNARDQNIAFQAAESTLLAAEAYILALSFPPSPFPLPLLPGLLNQVDPEPTNYFSSSTWSNANSANTPSGFAANLGIQDNPRYIIKVISAAGPITVFKITARSLGANPGTQIILQEVFVRTN